MDQVLKAEQSHTVRPVLRRLLAAFMGISLVAFLALTLVLQDGIRTAEEDTLTIRKVEVAIPPPPAPPPPLKVESVESEVVPTIDLAGPGMGPSLTFSANPKLSIANLQRLPQPDFKMERLDLGKALAVSFPLLEVKELDQIPRLVSTNRISFPRALRGKGVKRVETKVEIIIDQTGKAYVKHIVDPVYPEMVEVIRAAINDSKFTIPKKNGQPVQAIYLYTLVFINRL